MKTITQLQIDFITLYEKMYAVVPSFGTLQDWQDAGWLARMYDFITANLKSFGTRFHVEHGSTL
ncbi:MAG: hypothetical protein EBZ04_12855 [Betaproteobacteria bacterium]|nr:hypothetical protein [Betaproteobacteria bacterium]